MTPVEELRSLKQGMIKRARVAATLIGIGIVVMLICMVYGFIQSSRASLAVEKTIKTAEEIQMLEVKLAECNEGKQK